MPVYDRNLLPDTYDSNWTLSGATRINSNTGIRFSSAGSYARYSYNTTGFEATGYMLITCTNVVGDVFICIEYVDAEDEVYDSHVVKLSTGMSLAIILQEATVDSTITFTLYTSIANSQVGLVEALLMEQAIRSVDIEYASGTSRTTPPETGWSTDPPQWQTGRYIWQRTATTFVDGHVEYSDPVCLQNTESAGIYSIEEQYYLSTSSTSTVGGYWSTTQPTWRSGRYIWTRSRITWTDQTVTYSDATLAQALNQANEHAQEAIDAVEDLDNNLDQEGIFNRLTNNGQVQGLFLQNGRVYINATYIQSGTLIVRNSSNKVLFRADMSANSVYIAGFTIENTSMHTANSTSLGDTSVGIYFGTQGYTSGNGGGHITLSNGTLYGGFYDGATDGYITFFRYLTDSQAQITSVGSTGSVILRTPRFGIGDYVAYDQEGTVWYEGLTGAIRIVRSSAFEANPYVTNLQSNGSGGYTWTNMRPGYNTVRFNKGLMITNLPY